MIFASRSASSVPMDHLNEQLPTPQYVPYVDRFSRLYRISRQIRANAADVLFANEDKEIPTVVDAILSSFLAMSIDLRVKMAHKILLIGGTSVIRGFSTRLIQSLEQTVQNAIPDSKYASLHALAGHFELIISPKFYQTHLPWIGASIDSTIDGAHAANQITQNDFLQRKKPLPDWASLTSTT